MIETNFMESFKKELSVKEVQYHKQGDLYYCLECDHILTIREGKIIDSSCKHPYINYIPVSEKEFIQMILEKPHLLREGYKNE